MLAKMSHSYYVHFAEYSRIRKNVTQLVSNLVWWKVYEDFWKEFPNITYQEETLKETLRYALNSTKTWTFDEQGTKNV